VLINVTTRLLEDEIAHWQAQYRITCRPISDEVVCGVMVQIARRRRRTASTSSRPSVEQGRKGPALRETMTMALLGLIGR
jgi:hypothetical protein